MLGQDGAEERDELWVRGEALWGHGERGAGSYCKLRRGRGGGEEREKGFCRIEGVFVHELGRVRWCRWLGGG